MIENPSSELLHEIDETYPYYVRYVEDQNENAKIPQPGINPANLIDTIATQDEFRERILQLNPEAASWMLADYRQSTFADTQEKVRELVDELFSAQEGQSQPS